MSSAVSVFAIANLGVAIAYVFFMVTGGLLLNLSQLPKWVGGCALLRQSQGMQRQAGRQGRREETDGLGWLMLVWQVLPLKYLSIFRYALSSLCIVELDGLTFDCSGTRPGQHYHRPTTEGLLLLLADSRPHAAAAAAALCDVEQARACRTAVRTWRCRSTSRRTCGSTCWHWWPCSWAT